MLKHDLDPVAIVGRSCEAALVGVAVHFNVFNVAHSARIEPELAIGEEDVAAKGDLLAPGILRRPHPPRVLIVRAIVPMNTLFSRARSLTRLTAVISRPLSNPSPMLRLFLIMPSRVGTASVALAQRSGNPPLLSWLILFSM